MNSHILNSTSYLYQNNCIVPRLGYVTRKCYGTTIELSCQFALTIQIQRQPYNLPFLPTPAAGILVKFKVCGAGGGSWLVKSTIAL